MDKNASEIEQIKLLLRDSGLRATAARVSVWRALVTATKPMSHQDVTNLLVAEGVEKSTVFRALTDLTEAKLLRKMELGDHVWRFETTQDKTEHASTPHPHLLCVDCGDVECLDDDQVQLQASQAVGPIEDVLLKGHCKKCR